MAKCTHFEEISISSPVWLDNEEIKDDQIVYEIGNNKNLLKILIEWLSPDYNLPNTENWIEKTLKVNWNEITWIVYYWWEQNLIFSIDSIKRPTNKSINQILEKSS